MKQVGAELAFDCDISKALVEISTSDDYSEEVFLLSKAAKVLRTGGIFLKQNATLMENFQKIVKLNLCQLY